MDVHRVNTWDKPNQTLFHESGHFIDRIARDKVKDTTELTWHFSSAYKDGLFPKTITDEVNKAVNKLDKELKQIFKNHDREWLIANGYLSKYSYNSTYSKAIAYSYYGKQIKNDIGSTNAISDLSDILEGATRGKISLGFGHGKSYWEGSRHNEMLGTEAFAEMIDSTMAAPESLEAIKKYLPESYSLFEEMLKELLK